MTTFPYDKKATFQSGINVIFGPNHSGKTTLVNSIRYGLFGMSFCRIPEGVQIKYFSDRINEKEKKSLTLSTAYSIESQSVTVKRTIFASGGPKIEVSMTKDVGKELTVQTKTAQLETDYDNYLKNKIAMSPENLPYISDLMFADENRQPFLWLDGVEKFVLDMLTSRESTEKLNFAKESVEKEKAELKKLEENKKRIIADNNQKQLSFQSIKRELEKIEGSDVGKSIAEYSTLMTDFQNCRSKIAEANNSLGEILRKKSSFLKQLEVNTQKFDASKRQKEKLQADALKVFLTNPSTPEQYHLRHLIYNDKKCPMCYSDLSSKISGRLDSQLCPLCGEGALPGNIETLDQIQIQIKSLDEEQSTITQDRGKLSHELEEIEKNIEEINKIIEGYKVSEKELSAKLAKSRSFEEELLSKQIKNRRLKELQEEIEANLHKIVELEKTIAAQEKLVDEATKLSFKALESCRIESNKSLLKVKQRFFEFFSTARNGDKVATLSDDLVPILNGRRAASTAVISQSEKVLMDYAFRIAVLSTCAENSNTVASLVLEAPDDVIDRAYLQSLVKAIKSASTHLSIIITTLNTDFLDYLVEGYDIKGKDKERLTSLLSPEGTLTQKKYFTPKLMQYSSEAE